jgi:SlyX protein
MGNEDRLAELETRVSFQERLLTELNDQLAGQSQQLEALKEAVRVLHERLQDVAPSQLADAADETPPPHY